MSTTKIEIKEIINELENKFNNLDHNEIDFEAIDEKIYQYQHLSKFFDVEPEKLYSIKSKILLEINTLENFDERN